MASMLDLLAVGIFTHNPAKTRRKGRIFGTPWHWIGTQVRTVAVETLIKMSVVRGLPFVFGSVW
jgi:hypothetical protein